MTSNVGTESIALYRNDVSVDSYEIDKNTYKLLLENIKDTRITPHNEDSTTILTSKHDYDIILLDAPWGGSDYKGTGNLLLRFNNFRRDIFKGLDVKNPLKDIELTLGKYTLT